jgi:hypothetical protein
MGRSLKDVEEIYNSMNMTLPVFTYMYWGPTLGTLISAFMIWGFFLITAGAFRIHPIFGICLLASLYIGLLTFFDFVMFGKGIIVSLISATIFLLLSKVSSRLTKN